MDNEIKKPVVEKAAESEVKKEVKNEVKTPVNKTGKYIVISRFLNARTEASLSAPIAFPVADGTIINCVRTIDDGDAFWLEFNAKNHKGYVLSTFVKKL